MVAELAGLRERVAALEHANRRLAGDIERARAEGERAEGRTVRHGGQNRPKTSSPIGRMINEGKERAMKGDGKNGGTGTPPWHGLYDETETRSAERTTIGPAKDGAGRHPGVRHEKWRLKYGWGWGMFGMFATVGGWALGTADQPAGPVIAILLLPAIPLGAWIVNGVKGRGWRTTEGFRRMFDASGRAFVAQFVLWGYMAAGALPALGVLWVLFTLAQRFMG